MNIYPFFAHAMLSTYDWNTKKLMQQKAGCNHMFRGTTTLLLVGAVALTKGTVVLAVL